MEKELLTFLECKQILASYSDGDLIMKNFKITPATEALGYLGEYYQLQLNCNSVYTSNSVDINFFIKLLPEASDEDEKIFIFKKEANLYGSLLKELQAYTQTIWCPKAFYIREDLIVLNDLRNLGYENCKNKTKNLNDFEMKAILKAAAALHAASIIHEIKNNIKIDEKYPVDILKEITISPQIAWFTTGLKTIMDLAKHHPKFQTNKLRNFIENDLKEHLNCVYEMQKTSKKYRNVVCHRDLWYANIMFNYTTNNAILVDYQTCRYCPPAIDIMFALFLNLDNETRKSKELEYLLWYHKEFQNEFIQHKMDINNNQFYEEFLKSYEDLKLLGYVYRAIAFTLIKVPKELITNEYKYIDRSKKLLSYMKINREFQIQMESCIEGIINYILERTLNVL